MVHLRIKREVATTTYPNLNLRQYLGEPLPIPDLPTQRAIADFLDRETARIDSLIEKKQRLVELLGEKYETETIRLMTRGVRGDESEFVSSIYNWAPDVPAHWTQTPLSTYSFSLHEAGTMAGIMSVLAL